MNELQIKVELLRRGIKQREIARATGKSDAAVSMVISGKRTSSTIQKYISSLLNHLLFLSLMREGATLNSTFLVTVTVTK